MVMFEGGFGTYMQDEPRRFIDKILKLACYDEDDKVRLFCVEHLAHIGSNGMLPRLRRLLALVDLVDPDSFGCITS